MGTTKRSRRSSPGNITALSPGRYRVRLTTGYDGGVQKQHSETFVGSRAEAERHLTKLAAAHDAPTRSFRHATVEELMHRFLARRGEKKHSTHTYMAAIICDHIGHLDATELGSKQVESFYTNLDRPQASVHRVHSTLGSALSWAFKDGLIAHPAVTRQIRVSSGQGPMPYCPTDDEVSTVILDLFRINKAYGALATFLASTGCRHGEALGLSWSDVHKNTVTLWATKTRDGSRKPRQNYVDSSTIAVLRALGNNKGFVFSDDGGATAFTSQRVQRAFKKAWARCDVKVTQPTHVFRHYVTTKLLSEGVQVHEVCTRLGWASPRMLFERYASVLPAADRRAGEVMGKVLAATLAAINPQPPTPIYVVDRERNGRSRFANPKRAK
jgi:integrase